MIKKIWIDTTGDVVAGDTIRFNEAVFAGSFRNPKFLGDREIIARVDCESYGAGKQQHTFSLTVIDSTGQEPIAPGVKIRRKGRNVYRNGTERLLWKDEEKRDQVREEKHARGAVARTARAERKNNQP